MRKSKTKAEVKALMEKLYELAQRGVGGEKETAQKKLDKLIESSGISLSELKKEEPKYYTFSYTYPYKLKLLGQCIYKVVGAANYQVYKSKGTRNKLGVYCTPSQKLEIELEYEYYSNLFDIEVDSLLDAFISKQDIYPIDVPRSTINRDDMSDDEIAKWEKMQSYANNIKKQKRASGMIEQK